ncbi:DUF2231 domain-containing protein [Amycolatopsis magusensis]|uniref:Membrane protein n=1 Tax=Amycolatopsis magusensis TaxID=882444 RepID=A0ABS4Q1L2_9PSEU|nr:DUF2231 domain-containing protein [Amycolatopsis magusensis]MBP2185564.1 putative membrane protein [Amycolatopsis magusensis]
MNPHQLLQRVESWRAADGPAAGLADRIRRTLDRTKSRRALRGAWLGHPLHPLLVTVPIGAWVCSAIFDFGTGDRDAACKLVAFGLAATPPTMLLGLADYAELDQRQRRVGLAHAAANATGAALFAVSYLCRARGAHRAGAAAGLAGLTAIGAGGALGGHLSYAQGAGVHRWQSS